MKENSNTVKKRWIAGGLSLAMMVSLWGDGYPFSLGGDQEDITVSLSGLTDSGGQGIELRTLNAPMLGTATPEIGSSTPEIESGTPEIGSGTPEIGSSTPEIGSGTPEMEPNTTTPEPETSVPEPEASTPEPEESQSPEIGTAVPETGENVLTEEESEEGSSEGEEGDALPEGEEYLELHGDANVDEAPTVFSDVQEDGKTSLSITLPSSGIEGKEYIYEVTLVKAHYNNSNGNYTLVYPTATDTYARNKVTYTDRNGNESTGKAVFYDNYTETGTGSTSSTKSYTNRSANSFENGTKIEVQGGTTMTVHNLIWDSNTEYEEFNELYFGVTVANITDYTKNVQFEPVYHIVKEDPNVNTMTGTVINWDATRETENTYQSLGGVYSLVYLLNRYNAVSFNNIEGSHIVGPVIAMGHAAGNGFSSSDANLSTDEGSLVVADYSIGQFSYIGSLYANKHLFMSPAVNMNYFYDRKEAKDNTFDVPDLYTGVKGQFVVQRDYDKWFIARAVLGGDIFLSPNDSGDQDVWQNDAFIDGEALRTVVQQDSQYIYDNGYLKWDNENKVDSEDIVKIDVTEFETDTTIQSSNRYIEIKYGGSYHITNNSDISDWFVVMDFTEHDYGIEGDKVPTIINIEHDALTYDNQTQKHVFPEIKVRYKEDKEVPVHELEELAFDRIDSSGSGAGIEYNVLGNRVVWNLYNFQGTLRFPEKGKNVPGHIIMPDGKVENSYLDTDGLASWNGGNLNGCLIADDIQTGIMELHMWPYGGEELREEVEDEYFDPELEAPPSHILPETGGRVDLVYLTGTGIFGFGLILFWISRKKSGVI